MKKLWRQLINLGITASVKPSYRKYIQLTNTLAMVTSLWLIAFTPSLLFFPEAYLILLTNLLLAAMVPVILWLNHKKYYLWAKHAFGLLAFIAIIVYASLAGTRPNIHGYTLLVLITAFLIYSEEERYYIYIACAVSVAEYFILDYLYTYKFSPLLPIAESFIYFTRLNLFGMLFVIVFLLMSYSNSLVRGAEKDLALEKQKSDELLLNILPQDVATELKEKGSSIPVRFDNVSVLFTDFVGFTQIAEGMSAEAVIDELDKCFTQFDEITRRYNLEKIKTIGDSYMLAGGLPLTNFTHAIDSTLAALEIQSFMNQMQELKQAQGLPYWQLRLGIHSGPLVAGVIGQMKFNYDVFGDTVNTSSRMESSGEAGKINISQTTYDLVKFLFVCEPRGKVFAKNKGEIEMYFVNAIKPKYSVNGEGKVPNDKFRYVYEKLKEGAKLVAKD